MLSWQSLKNHQGDSDMGEADGDAAPDDGVYCLRVRGHLSTAWIDWFDGLTITAEADGTTTLIGPVADQPAL